MVLILDWSAITKNRLYSLLSGTMPLTRATDVEEIRYRVAKMVFELVDMVKPSVVVIAKDNKHGGKRNYWRSGYLARYYLNETEQLVSLSDMAHYIRFDNSLYTYDGETIGKKMTKKDTPKDLEIVEDWDMSVICGFAPTYKGNRKAQEWVFETSEREINEAFGRMAVEIAGILPNVKIVDATLAEADDIAGVLCLKSGREHTLATVDGDWHQLINEKVKLINIANMEYVEKTSEEIARELQIKFVMGDSGDGVKSTWVDGKAKNLGQKGATEIVDAGETDTVNAKALERNTKLIRLDLNTIPKMVQKNILDALKEKKEYEGCTWESMGLPKREQDIMTNTGSTLTQKHSPSVVEARGTSLTDDDLPF